jgi:hypothetical protein
MLLTAAAQRTAARRAGLILRVDLLTPKALETWCSSELLCLEVYSNSLYVFQVIVSTKIYSYRAIHVKRARELRWRDAPNIGQGFWSPDDDQKQASCKERPSPQ